MRREFNKNFTERLNRHLLATTSLEVVSGKAEFKSKENSDLNESVDLGDLFEGETFNDLGEALEFTLDNFFHEGSMYARDLHSIAKKFEIDSSEFGNFYTESFFVELDCSSFDEPLYGDDVMYRIEEHGVGDFIASIFLVLTLGL